MSRRYLCGLGLVLLLTSFHYTTGADQEKGPVRLIIKTELGDMEAELDPRAPITMANFLKYVDAKMYDGGRFFRTVKPDNQPDNKVKIEVVQADINPERKKDRLPAIKMERTSETGIKHVDGSLSMPRNAPDSGRDGFSICLGDQPEMDFGGKRNPDGQGFAAFGRVVKGLEVARKIQASPAEAQKLTPPIKILTIMRKP